MLWIFAYGLYNFFDLIDLFVYSFDMFSLRIENELFFEMISIDKNLWVFLYFAVGDDDSTL